MRIVLLVLTVTGMVALSIGDARAFHNEQWCGNYTMARGTGVVSPWGPRILGYDYPRWRIGGEPAVPLATPGYSVYELLDAVDDFPIFGVPWLSPELR
jgi:hypothetical protein